MERDSDFENVKSCDFNERFVVIGYEDQINIVSFQKGEEGEEGSQNSIFLPKKIVQNNFLYFKGIIELKITSDDLLIILYRDSIGVKIGLIELFKNPNFQILDFKDFWQFYGDSFQIDNTGTCIVYTMINQNHPSKIKICCTSIKKNSNNFLEIYQIDEIDISLSQDLILVFFSALSILKFDPISNQGTIFTFNGTELEMSKLELNFQQKKSVFIEIYQFGAEFLGVTSQFGHDYQFQICRIDKKPHKSPLLVLKTINYGQSPLLSTKIQEIRGLGKYALLARFEDKIEYLAFGNDSKLNIYSTSIPQSQNIHVVWVHTGYLLIFKNGYFLDLDYTQLIPN